MAASPMQSSESGRRAAMPIAGAASGMLALVAFLWAIAVPPQGASGVPSEEEIRLRAAQVAEISARQAGILDRLELARMKIRLSGRVLRRAQAERERLQREIAENERRGGELEASARECEKYLAERMRQMYALGILQEYRVYFAASSTQDVMDATVYLSALAREDERQIRAYRGMRAELAGARKALESRRASLQEVQNLALSERTLLGEEHSSLVQLLSQVAREKALAQRALEERASAAEKLDRTVAALAVSPRPVGGQSMSRSKGSLPRPVKGRLVAPFGDVVHPRFKTRVPHPGLDFLVLEGAPVRSVFGGEVAFAGWLSGYGYTVILNHPGGFHTVSAHLDQILVSVGESVPQGATLATAGGGGEGSGTPFYFELREGGQAVNPQDWFQAPKRGKKKVR